MHLNLIHRCQKGFTTVTLMGTLMVGGLPKRNRGLPEPPARAIWHW